ncbi:hypothetical protein KCU95_g12382, partial [Aureobasidium melanogenum]
MLNTSRIGTHVFNTTFGSSDSDSNIFSSIWDNLTSSIRSSLDSDIKALAQELGVHDFYSAHLLNYCEGYYTPSSIPNTTATKPSIRQNVTYCSNRTSFFHLDPTTALQTKL